VTSKEESAGESCVQTHLSSSTYIVLPNTLSSLN